MASSEDEFRIQERQNCPICLGDFKIPRQLPCMHSFCEKCLQDYISSREETVEKFKIIECPICRLAVCPEEKGKSTKFIASMFPINVILQSILGEAKVKVDRSCDICHSANKMRSAQNLCVECEEGMCDICSEVHRNQKISRNHVIISVEEFASNPYNVMKLAKGFSCSEHDGEAIDFYCKDHKTACCSKCCIVRHRNCASVSDLKKELPNLMQEVNPDNVIEHMRKLETHLKQFVVVNESNISLIESKVNDFISQVREFRKKINDVLDELERKVKIKEHTICKEEIIRKQEENHHCQSLINSIRNSHTLLETVKKYGTETQVFLMTDKMTSQLTSYLDQIQERYTKIETTTVLLEVDPQFQSILVAGSDSLAKTISRKELQSLPVPCIRKPSGEYLVQRARIIEIKCSLMNYSGVTYLYSGQVLLADYANRTVCLLDSSYNVITSYKLSDYLFEMFDICAVNDEVFAISMDKRVQFLSFRNGKITPTTKINTRYRCQGIADAGKGKIVISGQCSERGKYYWSLISKEGKEESCHQFVCEARGSYTYVALDSLFTRVYILLNVAHSLYCFEASGIQKFVYHDDTLLNPRGVATDKYDNVYVIGYDSNNIHQLTPDGAVIQIISEGVPTCPRAICFSRDGDEFLVTNYGSDGNKLYKYRLT